MPTKHVSQNEQIGVELWLSSGEHNPTNSNILKCLYMRSKIRRGDLPRFPNLPNVTHHASAIALIVWRKYENGNRADFVRRKLTCFLRTRGGGNGQQCT